MAMLPSGYWVRSPRVKYHSDATVRGPRRPIYIIRMLSSDRAEGADHLKQDIPQTEVRLKHRHQVGAGCDHAHRQQRNDGRLAEAVMRDRIAERLLTAVGCSRFDALQQGEEGGGLDTAAG